MRLGVRDQRVLAAFVEKRPAEGRRLSTDGERVDGHWLGGARIAEWVDGPRGLQIAFNDLGSRAAASVARGIRRHAALALLLEPRPAGRAHRPRSHGGRP